MLISDETITSEAGVQQGDPLGPLLFALGVDDIARSISSPVNLWYLDDVTLGGPVDIVLKDLRFIIPNLAAVGLIVNPSKSEIINVDCGDSDFVVATEAINDVLEGARVTKRHDLVILGAPILQPAIETDLRRKTEALKAMSDRLRLLDAHPALFLLRNCFAMPKLLYVLRSAPCYTSNNELTNLDYVIRSSAENITNVHFDDTGWQQAILPISLGGLGLRSASDVALPAYCSSLFSCRPLVEDILK